MSDKETGGPAFPLADSCCEYGNTTRSDANGMTLRDYFAAKAMQGDIASMVDPTGERCGIQIDLAGEILERLGRLYYRIADAMLKAREQ